MGTGYWEHIADVIETPTPEEAQAQLASMSREERSAVEALIMQRRAARDGKGAR
jgi:hypothetical protein